MSEPCRFRDTIRSACLHDDFQSRIRIGEMSRRNENRLDRILGSQYIACVFAFFSENRTYAVFRNVGMNEISVKRSLGTPDGRLIVDDSEMCSDAQFT